MASTSTVLVTGATGTQGSSTIRSLRSICPTIKIHAFVRDPTSTASRTLAALSHTITLFTGTFDSIPSLTAAAKTCTVAFINVTPDFTDPTAEQRHAANILTALASTLTITRIVFSSLNGCADPTQPGTFSSLPPSNFMYGYLRTKHAHESAVITTATTQAWDWTILQPATFLTNFLPPSSHLVYPALASERKIVTALPPHLKLNYLDPEDVGRFAAAALMSSGVEYDRFKGKRIPLASLYMTLQEVVDSMNGCLKKWGRDVEVKVEYMGAQEVEVQEGRNPLVDSQLYLAGNPGVVDLEAVREFGIGLGGLSEFWEEERVRVEKAVGL